MEKSHDQLAIVILPLPSQSHLNQLLHLSLLLSSHHLPVHFLGSATHNRQANLRSHSLNPNPHIHFHDLPTPPIDTPDPSSNPDKSPVHMAPAILAYMELRRPVGEFVRNLSNETRKIVVIYDRLIVEAVGDAVSVPNVEHYAFNCLSAFSLFYILWEAMGKPFDIEGDQEDNINTFSVKDFFPENIIEFIVSKPQHFEGRGGDIHNTVRLIEGKYVNLLGRKEISGINKKQWAICPTLVKPRFITKDTKLIKHRCLDWLDKNVPNSVIYVSFGTSISLSEEEIRELALGLEQSEQKFIWVLRDADKADIFAGGSREIELPRGFEDRVKENGIIVRDWAPQMEILAHESTGGFMSHCGWNSCIEGLSMGVPIAAWPMHSDQPLNAIFVTEVLKTGFMVREWDKRGEVVKASVVRSVVERMMALEEGDEVRKRAEEISVAMNKEMEDGGELCREMESFIAHISR